MRRQRDGRRWRVWRRWRGTRCNTSYDAFAQTCSPKSTLPWRADVQHKPGLAVGCTGLLRLSLSDMHFR